MNAKISVFAFCVEVIIYLLLHNLHDCTFKVTKFRNIFDTFLLYLSKIPDAAA